MSNFFTAFVRPIFPPMSVFGFLTAGGVRPLVIAAVCVGMYMTLLEIGRQGGYK